LKHLSFWQQEETHIMENVLFCDLIRRGFYVDVGLVVQHVKTKDDLKIRKQLEVDFVVNRRTLAGNQRSGYPCSHSDDKLVEASARASFCTVSMGASNAGLVQRIGGDEPDCSFMCRGEFENGYCSVDSI
jgi:hypothetical protein